jgi:hypothetical protein
MDENPRDFELRNVDLLRRRLNYQTKIEKEREEELRSSFSPHITPMA